MYNKPIPIQHQKQLELIGLYIKNLRINENLTQMELSEFLNLHYNSIQRIESGGNTTLLTIFELADYFGYKPSELLSILD